MELLRLLSSPRIMEVLFELSLKPRTKSELMERLNISMPHVTQILNKTMNLELLEKVDDRYRITEKGLIVLKTYDVVRNFNRFLEKFTIINDYSLEDIPPYLIERMHQLSEAKLIEKKEDTFRPHEEFVDAVIEARYIKGYTSIFFPEHVTLFSSVVDEKDSIELVVSRYVMKEILSNYREELKWGLSKPNVKFYVARKNYKISFIITDKIVMLFFYLKNGFFDYRREVLCYTDACRDWGNSLYSYVVENAVMVRPEDVDSLKL